MSKISSPVLSPNNQQAVYVYNDQLMILDNTFDQGKVLLKNIAGASHVKWSSNSMYIAFILDGQLKIVMVETAEVVDVPISYVSQFEWGANFTLYVTTREGDLYSWSLQSEAQLLLERAVIEAYSIEKEMAVVKCSDRLFAVKVSEDKIGKLQQITPEIGRYEQVAFSFTGQYVAYIGTTKTERHVYVYDFELGVTQNLTELLDVYAGDAIDPFSSANLGIKEIQWIETDALYFQVSSDGDVRLYYADLYGSLFPATPENEHLVSYSVARNGNWALYVATKPFIEVRLALFDITTGEGRTIDEFPVSVNHNVETYYEIVENEGITYYMWGYVPTQCETALVVRNGQGRMFGNSYNNRITLLNRKQAVVYVNHPGAFGYGQAYASAYCNEGQGSLQIVVESWLKQKTGRLIDVILN